ncbi:hypothetical protein [Exiguobacterium sp. s181]|uniref:hypothetical protein n=1 Tax=Exiguobacterium sp. s181 TaxID=2751288 RepID=UPI001BE6C74A|nr:hypothetical protein [Exiguobacterium sp. s181]
MELIKIISPIIYALSGAVLGYSFRRWGDWRSFDFSQKEILLIKVYNPIFKISEQAKVSKDKDEIGYTHSEYMEVYTLLFNYAHQVPKNIIDSAQNELDEIMNGFAGRLLGSSIDKGRYFDINGYVTRVVMEERERIIKSLKPRRWFF